MTDYQRKLYAFLQSSLPHPNDQLPAFFRQLACWDNIDELRDWWAQGQIARDIGASSDRINLRTRDHLSDMVEVRHPISGQPQTVTPPPFELVDIPEHIKTCDDAKQVFWWFWRFYPEYLAKANSKALLYPAHRTLPDCPLHSYQSTVSALVGALANQNAEKPEDRVPYLLLFSFSPVQDFIKASRKFLDFWAGSYLLHYLSARLCWHIAQIYGPDAIIVPSLWGQDIVDAFWLKQYGQATCSGQANPDYSEAIASLWQQSFADLGDGLEPVQRFDAKDDKRSNSLSTAGFPNMITVLLPGKAAAEKLGNDLAEVLAQEWQTISALISRGIRTQVIDFLTNPSGQAERDAFWAEFAKTLSKPSDLEKYRQEAQQLEKASCWEWGHLWAAQIDNTWEPYWAAVPLGNPDQPLVETSSDNYETWANQQSAIAWPPTELPSPAEKAVYTQELNVGTWWGSLQQRLRTAHMAVKNTRHWQIPAAPGPRSSLSGQFSAVHPRLNYQERRLQDGTTRDFREGGGLPDSSMRLFWLLMSYAYKGLFNGSEMLNALELTKRMAWQFGGVADSMGINTEKEQESLHLDKQDRETLGIDDKTEIDYEKLIRFPNLSSIAAARFMYAAYQDESSSRLKTYWSALRREIREKFSNPEHRRVFGARTRGRPTQVSKTDQKINRGRQDGHDYNGVMFSPKWLADEMNLEKSKGDDSQIDEVTLLRQAIDAAHKETGFGDGSPGDWWVIVLGDGDGMGNYISGETLHKYRQYIVEDAIDKMGAGFNVAKFDQLLDDTQKRMGPATHIGLNRALLDFSNRLVPYLTEKRYCGRVIYSGGDDVMAVLPLEDVPGYLRSLRAAWSGEPDPYKTVNPETHADPVEWFEDCGGYWHPKFREGQTSSGLPDRPHFTMGKDATMSLGIVIANKAVPLPTVLESLWDAEQTAKAMPGKDGLCFRVIYGGGNTLETLMKGSLLDDWWALIDKGTQSKDGQDSLSPILYRLAEELPKRASVTENYNLFAEAAKVIVSNRDESKKFEDFEGFCNQLMAWLKRWEAWVKTADPKQLKRDYNSRQDPPLPGTSPDDLGYLLRFSAFWVSKNAQRQAWVQPQKQPVEVTS